MFLERLLMESLGQSNGPHIRYDGQDNSTGNQLDKIRKIRDSRCWETSGYVVTHNADTVRFEVQ